MFKAGLRVSREADRVFVGAGIGNIHRHKWVPHGVRDPLFSRLNGHHLEVNAEAKAAANLFPVVVQMEMRAMGSSVEMIRRASPVTWVK